MSFHFGVPDKAREYEAALTRRDIALSDDGTPPWATRVEGYIDCPGNNCGDPLSVTMVDGVVVGWPARCPSCGFHLPLPPEGAFTEGE